MLWSECNCGKIYKIIHVASINIWSECAQKFFEVPFLPAEHIPAAFARLQEKATTDQLRAVMTYVQTTWMTSTVWPVTSWTVFGRSIRTNNDVEGWHHRINRHAQKSNLSYYLLIELLYKEASRIPLQLKLIGEGKLRRQQKKRALRIQCQLYTLWEDYASNRISVSRLLKKCGSVYGPVLQFYCDLTLQCLVCLVQILFSALIL